MSSFLTRSISQYIALHRPPTRDAHVSQVIDSLGKLHIPTRMHGSAKYKTDIHGSNIDFLVHEVVPTDQLEKVAFLKQALPLFFILMGVTVSSFFARRLEKDDAYFANTDARTRGIPLVTAIHSPTGTSVNFSFTEPHETPATDIINEYMTQSPTLRPLLLAVKAIFRDAGLNDRSGSTYRVRSFSSFAITLVTITTLLETGALVRLSDVSHVPSGGEFDVGTTLLHLLRRFAKAETWETTADIHLGQWREKSSEERGWVASVCDPLSGKAHCAASVTSLGLSRLQTACDHMLACLDSGMGFGEALSHLSASLPPWVLARTDTPRDLTNWDNMDPSGVILMHEQRGNLLCTKSITLLPMADPRWPGWEVMIRVCYKGGPEQIFSGSGPKKRDASAAAEALILQFLREVEGTVPPA